ncbi:hypothetical protein NQ318_013968 [Aromia moschata]|uniref:Uncharacterized protein n=1 Tax=Aromia moschata TaxID=1265417 RepID=A0AAV8YZV5_9CUCU|nr:hypothetical protein NQ318_013968 [Aromia moschata]
MGGNQSAWTQEGTEWVWAEVRENKNKYHANFSQTSKIIRNAGLFELLLRGFRIILFQEVRGDVAEDVEVHLPRAIRIVLDDLSVELCVVEELAHAVKDGGDLDGLDEAALLRVEHLERLAQDGLLLFLVVLERMC